MIFPKALKDIIRRRDVPAGTDVKGAVLHITAEKI
jgi:hypothetical protein